MVRGNGINGIVLNWSSVEMSGLHIDPLTVRAKAVIDATGHPTEITKIVEEKMGGRLNTATGRIMGEKSMWADRGHHIFPTIFDVRSQIETYGHGTIFM